MTTDRSLPGTVTLGLLTVVAACTLGRLFADASWLPAVVSAAVASHLAAWGARRARLPLAIALLLQVVVAALVIAWVVLPGTTAFGLPGLHTLHVAAHDLGRSAHDFKQVVAPAPVTDGFLVACVLGTVVCATLADWAAFRMQASFEAAIPSFTLFLFSAVLGTPSRMALAVAAYVGGLALFLVVHQAERAASTTAWFANEHRTASAGLARAGVLIGGVAVLAALLLGPHIPGAGQPAVVAWRNTDRNGPGNRSTVSPLVDIRGRLVDQSAVELFTVKSNRRAYWRLTSLDTFDGSIWSSNGSYRPAHGGLPQAAATAPGNQAVQSYSIETLNSIWLPAAYQPDHVSGVSGVSYNSDSGSLISDNETSNGLTYTVQSVVPDLTSAQLNRATGAALPTAVRDHYLALPTIPAVVDTTARQAVAGAQTPYAKALALEHFFRKGDFVYDLNVPAGHDDNALVAFLKNKRGYCEQFAGTYAVMARDVGLPTRVAVGFTPGDLESDGVYHVRGLNAHAWPEVYLDGYGWVAFEPTPGRGIPGAQSYTGVPEAQANETNPSTATTLAPGTTVPTPGSSRTRVANQDQGAQVHTHKVANHTHSGAVLVLVLLTLAGAVLVLWGAGVPMAARALRRRRRAAATTPGDRVLVAWGEALGALARAGTGRRPWETPAEYARRVGGSDLTTLADAVTAASYSAGGLAPEVAARAQEAAARIEQAVRDRTPRLRRIWWHLDPRPLWRDVRVERGQRAARRQLAA